MADSYPAVSSRLVEQVDRESHNLKIVASNPTPAITDALENIDVFKGFFISGQAVSGVWQTIANNLIRASAVMSRHMPP